MPPKNTFSKPEIVETALKLLQEKGMQELTARKIAEELKTSVAPIYGYFNSIEDLKKEVMEEVKKLLLQYACKSYTDKPFLNTGVGVVLFARDYPRLFKILFLETSGYKDIILDFLSSLKNLICSDKNLLAYFQDEEKIISSDLWIYTYGLAAMVCVGLLDDSSDHAIIEKMGQFGKKEIGLFIKNNRG